MHTSAVKRLDVLGRVWNAAAGLRKAAELEDEFDNGNSIYAKFLLLSIDL